MFKRLLRRGDFGLAITAAALGMAFCLFAACSHSSYSVFDADTSEPLAGAEVRYETYGGVFYRTQYRARTDRRGFASFDVDLGDWEENKGHRIRIERRGYESQELEPASGRTEVFLVPR